MMSKQAKRLEREESIIASTVFLLQEKSFLDIKMSEVARESQCSMGAVYSHFVSKEDLLLACAIYVSRETRTLFSQVASEPLSAVEKLLTLILVNWLNDGERPYQYHLRQLAMTPAVWQRASPRLSGELDQMCLTISNIVKDVVEEFIKDEIKCFQGSLDEQVPKLLMGVWGLTAGLFQIRLSGFGLKQPEISNNQGFSLLLSNIDCLLKGWGWSGKLSDELVGRCECLAARIIEATYKEIPQINP